jgi:release factor glutamine methyltransferase
VETPRADAELLAGHVLGLGRAAVAAAHGRTLSPDERDALAALVERRARREPLQHVLGEWGFRRLTLAVDRRALIPRPETETVVERALALLAGRDRPAVLDVGTGSGAIALAIADEHPGSRVHAIDVSADALLLARENARRCGLDVVFEHRDLFGGLPPGPWDAVVANPPYVPAADRDGLAPEVRDWEPAEALFDTGATEAIARAGRAVLAPGGGLVLETADGAAEGVAALLAELGYRNVRVTRDLSGRERVVEGTA